MKDATPPCLVDAGPDGLSLRAEECGTFDSRLHEQHDFPCPVGAANGYVQQCQPCEIDQQREGARSAFIKTIHLHGAPQQSRRKFRQNSRRWAEGSPSATGLGTARRRETNVSKGTLAGDQNSRSPRIPTSQELGCRIASIFVKTKQSW